MELNDFFKKVPKAAIAFSGGVDSSYLLYAAVKTGADVKAYYVKTAFQPEFEFRDALALARQVGTEPVIIEQDILCNKEIADNPSNRCYFCKTQIFTSILKKAADDGYTVILDGTNASDDANDRPGMKALRELEVLSPLRVCGLTKADIRALSREAGLVTADKPSYSCLATRIHTGEKITEEKLKRIESSEISLMSLGFSDFRVRLSGNRALLQFTEEDLLKANHMQTQITETLAPYFDEVAIDTAARRKSQ